MNNIIINNKKFECYNSFVQDKYGNKLNIIFATTHKYWWEDIIGDFDIYKIIPFDYDMCGTCNLWECSNDELSIDIINKLNNFIKIDNPIYVYGNNSIIIIGDIDNVNEISDDLHKYLKHNNIYQILTYSTSNINCGKDYIIN